MKAVFRVDSSDTIGVGHISRCKSLARKLRTKGWEILFVHRRQVGDSFYELSKEFSVAPIRIPTNNNLLLSKKNRPIGKSEIIEHELRDAEETKSGIKDFNTDWLVVDHYLLGYQWEQLLRREVRNILTIEDLHDRDHFCDVLVNPKPINTHLEATIKCSVPKRCRVILGPKYALIDDVYSLKNEALSIKSSPIKHIFSFFGGVDAPDLTTRTIESISSDKLTNVHLDVVVGPNNPNIDRIRRYIKNRGNIALFQNLSANEMKSLIQKSDLAIGGAGVNAWERCCLGVPSLVVSLEKHQHEIAIELEKLGVVIYLGHHYGLTSHDIRIAVIDLINSPSRLSDISKKCSRLVDGLGAERIANIMLESTGRRHHGTKL